jgi:hypothetical protein
MRYLICLKRHGRVHLAQDFWAGRGWRIKAMGTRALLHSCNTYAGLVEF